MPSCCKFEFFKLAISRMVDFRIAILLRSLPVVVTARSGVAMQTQAIVLSMELQMAQLTLLSRLWLLLQISVSFSPFCAGWPAAVFPQNGPGRSFLEGSG
jgi:hypothetical protein